MSHGTAFKNPPGFRRNISNMCGFGQHRQKARFSEIVKPFLIEQGVEKKLVDLSILTKKFGKDNVKNLINKGYIVPIGTKGITLGS